ncbi:hypothetical protein DFJ73DRAFT_502977 [Zopfochytrium polystomum]|nr:hypothetical protein DFJ73DRAFT_502977 [Zopfochytrium polystomum]
MTRRASETAAAASQSPAAASTPKGGDTSAGAKSTRLVAGEKKPLSARNGAAAGKQELAAAVSAPACGDTATSIKLVEGPQDLFTGDVGAKAGNPSNCAISSPCDSIESASCAGQTQSFSSTEPLEVYSNASASEAQEPLRGLPPSAQANCKTPKAALAGWTKCSAR